MTSWQERLWLLSLAALVAPLLPLLLALYNARTWRRPRADANVPAAPAGSVSVLIPARDEERNIEHAVRSVLAQGDALLEVLVYDDESRDHTAQCVRELAREDARVQLLRGVSLPDGWVGKPHACDRLFQAARGAILLFMDADVRLAPNGLAALCSCLPAKDAAPRLVSAVPRQIMLTFFERLLLPLLHLTYTCWLPLRLAERWSHPAFVAANGQLLFAARATFEQLGGFTAVRNQVVDDVQLCRHAKQRGVEVWFVDGHAAAHCRMYQSARQVWAGFGKNLFEGLGSEWALALALLLHLACFVLPYAALGLSLSAVLSASGPASSLVGQSLAFASLGTLQNLGLRVLLAARHRQPWTFVLLHPLSVLVLLALALDSWWRSRWLGVRWSGRRYRGRTALGPPAHRPTHVSRRAP